VEGSGYSPCLSFDPSISPEGLGEHTKRRFKTRVYNVFIQMSRIW